MSMNQLATGAINAKNLGIPQGITTGSIQRSLTELRDAVLKQEQLIIHLREQVEPVLSSQVIVDANPDITSVPPNCSLDASLHDIINIIDQNNDRLMGISGSVQL